MSEKEWESFKKTVKPIDKTKKVISKKFKTKPMSIKKNSLVELEDLEIVLSDNWGHLEKNIHRKIIKGNIRISKTLDLHGNTVDESKKKVFNFVTQNFKTQNRLLLIICGKGERLSVSMGWQGTGILNRKIPDWLNSKALFDKVVWFDYAPQEKGGKGAYLVYLKRA